ncbi:MAG: metallopeptidase TldD-related protein [Candidatus Eisenbacteria bacterium]|jgi:predicted Zn-dependent protease|nr:metallopeptidase TldD-related protein [Candidatus Eisenbacteria bacterium]
MADPRRAAAALLLCVRVCAGAGSDAAPDDSVFGAMEDELHRSLEGLSMVDLDPPYFLSYEVREHATTVADARYDAMVRSTSRTTRTLGIDLRVGDPSLDNTNFYADWSDAWGRPADLVEEDDYWALRHEIWYRTDKAYKAAVERLAKKKAYLQSHPSDEALVDLSPVEPCVHIEDRQSSAVDQGVIHALLNTAVEACHEVPALQDWDVGFLGDTETRWFVSSEGSRVRTVGHGYALTVSGTTQAHDGQRLCAQRRYMVPTLNAMPTKEDLAHDVRRFFEELSAMAGADLLDEYAGPVLFTEYAAAQFMAGLFAEQLTLPRTPLVATEWMREYFQPGKLAGRVNRRVLPRFVTILDDPGRTTWRGMPLMGSRFVDDQGVRCRPFALVMHGRLVTLPITRSPSRKVSEPNGRAIKVQAEAAVPGISNLIVRADNRLSRERLIKELRRLCVEYELEFGLLVSQLEDPSVGARYRWTEARNGDDASLLPPPLMVYKVFADDGRMEPVRGLVFEDVTIRSLRDIVACGKDERAYNMFVNAGFTDMSYPASIITPSVLVEEMELKSSPIREPLPKVRNPLFASPR